jgi:replicative DNA helicase
MVNSNAYYELAQFLKEDDFYILRNRYFWRAVAAVVGRKEPVDYLTVSTELKEKGLLAEVGPAYLNHLLSSAPTSMHTVAYGKLVQRFSIRRRLMVMADDIKRLAQNETIPLPQVIGEIEAKQIEVVADYTGTSTKSISEAASDYYGRIEHLMHHPDDFKGLTTGLIDLDHMLNGLDPDTLSLFAGRPGMGKSALLMTIAINMAKRGKRVAYFSMEMLIPRLMRRILSMEAHINSETLKSGKLNQSEWSRFVKASGEVSKLPIFLDDTAVWTPLQLRAKLTSMKLRNGIDAFFIDHAGLMSGGARYQNNKVAEMAYISRSLKEMNMDLKIPLLVAVQLNRNCEERQDKRPLMSDLRDSGTWEQDADNIIFVYRDEVYNEATEFPNQADLITAKQRDGKIGTVSCYYEKTFTRFLNAAERSIDLSHL